eukprot:365217_1
MMSKILILTILFAITHTADFDVETNNFYVKVDYGNNGVNGHDLAQKYCETKFGTTLATIDTPEKSQELFDALSTSISYNEWYYIGLKGSAGGGTSDTWGWLDGTPMGSYTNWRSGEPSGAGPCVKYIPTLGWNDYTCTESPNPQNLICNKAAPIYVKFLVDVQLDHLSNGQECQGDCDGDPQCSPGLL